MTTPPKARRYHASPSQSLRTAATGSDGRSDAAKAAPAKGIENVRVELQRKVAMPTRHSESPVAGGTGSNPATDPPASPEPGSEAERERFMRTEPVDDGFPALGASQLDDKPAQSVRSDDEPDLKAKLQLIQEEQLTDRQLRIARRIALLHQIPVSSDQEAVLRLRERGIDPSHRAALGQILSSEGSRAQAAPSANAPAIMPQPSPVAVPTPRKPGTEVGPVRPQMPSREALTEERRAAEIYRIQRDIARRRRRRLFMLTLRLLLFVALPTALAGWYYFRVATPLYATFSQFQIQRAESASAGGAGGLLAGSQLATNPDSVAVQSYLNSRDAMLRLDADKGFKAAFQQPGIDPIKRLPLDASNEDAYATYRNSVRIGYDPTEGVIDMEVIAPDPALSEQFSLALIRYAEEQVDRMTARLRSDQMEGAAESYRDAETKVLDAQRRVQELQQDLGVLDPAAEGTVVMNQIATLEGQLSQKRLELGQLLANPRPQQSRVDAARGDISRLEKMIADTRQQLTQGNEQRASLAAITGELRIAESDLATRQELLAAAAAQMEGARIEANKQVRYLSLSVAPVPPDEATYPKAVQNTIVAFLIFSGIYLMLSLTVSILREQVST
ncbi:MAG: capsule biosynthesis protein [Paracoccus sp. (in: a-proteobacteria)]|uniref:capsule biosynthesis protein n=1 Tax=unclassified Paracoccus (in: a-proteobacteria) TaxID=2688777 RepID=UPI000C39E883|nr:MULTISPECIES: capsule biosynthesis protein [unclassified Paracoccus (in: a-proteobacteria)]MBA48284.1 capsule biosynthesis protein [Paracoccus sp. (in: a-proteobacteria)]|tara:strand:+ start:1242 stop:3092 length:1851 start_codon:yes stop_codon:yes gene_type:complete